MTLSGIILIDPHTGDYLISPLLFKELASLSDDGVINVQWFSRQGEPAHRHSFTVRPDNAGKKVWQELTENHNNFMNFTLEVKQ